MQHPVTLIPWINLRIPLRREIRIDDLDQKLQFDIRLQIALRSNAIRIMENSQTPEKFRQYISDRESKLRALLNVPDLENVDIIYRGRKIFP